MDINNGKKALLLKGEIQYLTLEETLIKFDRFVYYLLKKFDVSDTDYDMLQECNLGMIKAYNAYDISKNIQFMTFLTCVVRNQIFMLMRKRRKLSKEISLWSAIGANHIDSFGEDEFFINDLIKSEGFEDKIILAESFKEVEETFTKLEKQLIEYLKQDLSQKQIGTLLGISQSYISRIQAKLKNKITYFLKYDKLPRKHTYPRWYKERCQKRKRIY